MTLAYFPILDPQGQPAPYTPEWPYYENRYEKRYGQRLSMDFKFEHFGVHYQLHAPWTPGAFVKWSAGKVMVVGDYVRPGNSHVYMCAVAGAVGGSAPTWGTTHEGTTADGAVTWVCFPDSQIQAVTEFVDNRHGPVESFYFRIRFLSSWVKMHFASHPRLPDSGLVTMIEADIEFEKDF